MKKLLSILMVIVMAVSLCSCGVAEPEPTEPAAGFEEYTCVYTDERDLDWEEEIVYMANIFLTEHPILADVPYYEYGYHNNWEYRKYNTAEHFVIDENAVYNGTLRAQFVDAIHGLIAKIPEMSDMEILYEVKRIVAMIGDTCSEVSFTGWFSESQSDYFPIRLKEVEKNGELGYYAMEMPAEYSDMIDQELTAFNGVPIEEVYDRLLNYNIHFASHDDKEYCDRLVWNNWWPSMLINRKEELQWIGFLEDDANTADFTFTAEDGTQTTVTLTAVHIEELGSHFPISVKQLAHKGKLGFFTVAIPTEYSDMIYQELTAINGVPLEEVFDRLRPYISSDNRCFQDKSIWDIGYYISLFTQRDWLQFIGVVEENANTADFTFTAEDGTQTTVTLAAVPFTDPKFMVEKEFQAKDFTAEESYGYLVKSFPENNTVYARAERTNIYHEQPFCDLRTDVEAALDQTEELQKLVIDLRRFFSASWNGLAEFAEYLQEIETGGIYIFTDQRMSPEAMMALGCLREKLPDAKVIGTPTGPMNGWHTASTVSILGYSTPNMLLQFTIAGHHYRSAENQLAAESVYPDVTVYQTLHGYQNGIDTLLEYVKAD